MRKTRSEIQQERMEKYGIKAAGIKEGETLEHAYRRLAKQTDQRLLRLEELSKQPFFKGVKTYAYGLAAKDAREWGGSVEKPRFNIAAPENKKQLQAKINDMIRFLNSPTSTKSGIIKMYQKRTDALNKKYGTNFTWQEAGRFFENEKDKFAKDWVSSMVLTAIGVMQKNPEKFVSDMVDFSDKHKTVSDAEVNDAILEKLHKDGISADIILDAEDEPADKKPQGKTTAKKRTRSSAKSKKSSKSRKSRSSSNSRYAGKTIAAIIRAVGRGMARGARRR